MKYVINPCSHSHLLALLEQPLECFIIGEEKLSLRLSYTYAIEELVPVIEQIHAAGKAVFIDMHTMVTNDLLPYINELLLLLAKQPIAGVIFADPAIWRINQEQQLNIPLIWSSESTATNWYAVKYWYNQQVPHVALAKELTKTAIQSINDHLQDTTVSLEVQAFGPLNMFHSRRNLLNNYYTHLAKQDVQVEGAKQQYLHDRERGNYYPIFEDASGTHIMSPKDVCLISELDFLAAQSQMHFLRIDTRGHNAVFMDAVIALFIEARALLQADPLAYQEQKDGLYQQIAALYEGKYRTIDKGFFYKPTIY